MDSTKCFLLLALLVLLYSSAVICLSQSGEDGSGNDDRPLQLYGLGVNHHESDVVGSLHVSSSKSSLASSASSASGVLRGEHEVGGIHQDVRGSSSGVSSLSSSLPSSSSGSYSSAGAGGDSERKMMTFNVSRGHHQNSAASELGTKSSHDDPFVINRLEVIPVRNITTHLEHGVEISVSPSMLLRSGEWVTVTWKGVKEPSVYDWIAVYVPADADPSKVAPVKYKMACNHPDHVKYGSGSVQFRLLNMRDDYRFVLVRNWGTKPVVISRSNTVAFSNYDEPTQIHLALTGKQGEMRVTWTTRGRGRAPYVRWGMTAGEYTSSCPANTTTYTRTEMCGGPARSIGWVAPGYFHTAVMKGLKVGTNIFYSVGDDGYAHSNPKSFYVPPNVGPQSTVRMLAFGDLGQAEVDGSNDMAESMEPSLLTARRIIRDAYMDDGSRRQYGLLVLHAGDISYARGYTCQWDVFFDEIEPIASRVPYMVSVGNHERDWPGSGSLFQVEDSGGECGISYGRRLPMPLPSLPPPLSPLIIHPSSPVQRSRKFLSSSPSHSPSSLLTLFGLKKETTEPLFLDGKAEAASANTALKNAGLDTPWYSVDYGPIHFVVMSTEHDFKDGSAQFSFLEQDLASVNRRRTPWVIFSGHRPMYVDSTDDRPVQGDNPVAEQMKHGLEQLLMTYRVDLAMWGHHHTYERTCAVYRNKCVPPNSDGSFNAPVHLVVGMAGAGTCDNVRPVTPEWIEYLNTEQHGYVRLMVNATHLGYEFVGNNRGEILDRGFITRRFLW